MAGTEKSDKGGSGVEQPLSPSEKISGRRAELANRVLYSIANAVNVTPDLKQLYKVIHHALNSIIDCTNFFIAIVDRVENTLYFPYYVDTIDEDFSPITDFDTGSSLTGLVVLRKKPLLLSSQQLQARQKQQGIWGPLPQAWMGVPLIIRDNVIGVVAVQSYIDPNQYSEDDLDLLAAVSDQIALAIDRKRSLEELTQSENRFRQLFEQSNDAILIHDREGRIADCNLRATEMLGYSRAQLLEMHAEQLHFPEDLDQFRVAFNEILDSGHIRVESRLRTAGGEGVEVEISARVVGQKKQETVQAIIRDITLRKGAERRLRDNEQKYRNLFYNAQVGLFRTSPKGDTILECNDALARMAGFEGRKELLANLSLNDTYKNLLDRKKLLAALMNEGSIANYEAPMYRKNGELGWFRFTATYYPEYEWIEGVVVDITEMKKATEEKEILQRKLEQSSKMEALGMLAGGVAHDLNNMLAGIISYPELLLLKYGENPDLRKPLEAILESGRRAALIVEDMLSIARSAASAMEPFQLHEIVKEYLESPEYKSLEQRYPDVTLQLQLEASQNTVLCSPVHVKKCLMNLVINGFEAMGGYGTLLLRSSCGPMVLPHQQETAGEKVDAIFLTVHDTGSGISSQDMEHIFEPFYSKKMMGRSGTGLGLTVVWNTMQNHGGTVLVESGENGTSFTLVFPLHSQSQPLETSVSEERLARGMGQKILVVDDEPELRNIAKEILLELGYLPYTVSSGEEALDYLKQNYADLVVLDMLMEPGMNGAETFEKILQLHPQQRAIIASGFSETEDVKSALSLGVGKYIRKPYSMEQLARVVHEMLHCD